MVVEYVIVLCILYYCYKKVSKNVISTANGENINNLLATTEQTTVFRYSFQSCAGCIYGNKYDIVLLITRFITLLIGIYGYYVYISSLQQYVLIGKLVIPMNYI